MMLYLPYKDKPWVGPQPPPPSLRGYVRWRPLVRIRIHGPKGYRDLDEALLDTGADDTVFPLDLGSALRVRFQPVKPPGYQHRWRGRWYQLHFATVDLELTDDTSIWQWPAVVAFSAAPIPYGLLGQCGCLEFMDAKFLGKDHVIELESNDLYPGTVDLKK